MSVARPGDWVEDEKYGLAHIDFSAYPMQIPTDRYTSRDAVEREREALWLRVWQVAGRVDEVPEIGDWKEYRILDQSYVIVRGRDGELRGFVNACRHRGNPLCTGKGNAKRGFVCQYHLWSYDLDGGLRNILRQALAGPLDKAGHSLLPVSVDTFAGFLFLNPDPDAVPLAEFLGEEVLQMMAPYRVAEMTTVMNVRERIECNWKVVMDAFNEGYHINGIHPELLRVIDIDPTKSRHRFPRDHSVACAPFEVANSAHVGPELQVEGIRTLPATFPTVTGVLPRFEEIVDGYRDHEGIPVFPEGVTGRTLLQQATRDTLTGMGLDVSGLTDAQMSDNHGWVLFPNFFMTVRAGECHVVMAVPDPGGDPNACIWHVSSYMWLPPEHRDAFRAELIEVAEPGSYEYFLALQQDYEQMPRQQRGLRSNRLTHMALVREEIVIAHWHSVLDRYLAVADDTSPHVMPARQPEPVGVSAP